MKGPYHQGENSNRADAWQNKAQAGLKPPTQQKQTLGLKLSSAGRHLVPDPWEPGGSYLLTKDQNVRLRALSKGLKSKYRGGAAPAAAKPPPPPLSHSQSSAGVSSPSTPTTVHSEPRLLPAASVFKGGGSHQPQGCPLPNSQGAPLRSSGWSIARPPCIKPTATAGRSTCGLRGSDANWPQREGAHQRNVISGSPDSRDLPA